jgi:hypothetical protein
MADALLHPNDRAYSVPQLFDLLASGGLTFDRWVRQAPYSPRCGMIPAAADAARAGRLAPAEQFAAVELLRGTMVRHSLIARRDDSPDRTRAITFDGDAYLDYVPIRCSETVSVREPIPAGVAAVLINRAHDCTDIVQPLDVTETEWFEAIDGRRSIREIAGGDDVGASMRAFFERLWIHDHVVFDASRRVS